MSYSADNCFLIYTFFDYFDEIINTLHDWPDIFSKHSVRKEIRNQNEYFNDGNGNLFIAKFTHQNINYVILLLISRFMHMQ